MLREEITERLAAFETGHPVDTWAWDGWRAWPLLRTHLALSVHRSGPPAGAPRLGQRISSALRQRHRRLLARAAQRAPGARPDRPADVVFVTSTDRGQRLGRSLHNTVVDPWAEEIARKGCRASVWDVGAPRRFAAPGHASVQHAVDVARRRAAARCDAPPRWFAELTAFAVDELGAVLDWREIGAELATASALAERFEPWLRRARARAVVLDCWYLCDRMAAALAAHRLGIPAIDLQHGIQGRAHPAYAGWRRRPPGGYELFPDAFWVWGDWDAEALLASNPGAIDPDQVRVVGHRWLSAWTSNDVSRHGEEIRAAERIVGPDRTILVTLQKGVGYRETLEPLMRGAPKRWRWLVRLHRGMLENPRSVASQLSRATGRDVEGVSATRLPLHALLRVAHWHVTAFSTCALEALAFGVPTLLTHASGAHAYAEFVAAGVMYTQRSPENDVALLAGNPPGLADACRRAGRRVFADPNPGTPWCTSS